MKAYTYDANPYALARQPAIPKIADDWRPLLSTVVSVTSHSQATPEWIAIVRGRNDIAISLDEEKCMKYSGSFFLFVYETLSYDIEVYRGEI